jgi:putative transposase
MKKRTFTSEFKVKLVLELLREEQPIGALALEHGINPNQLSTWRREFLEKAPGIFDEPKKERERKQAEQEAADEKTRMLKTIGQLTMERDFLQAVQEKLDAKKGLL